MLRCKLVEIIRIIHLHLKTCSCSPWSGFITRLQKERSPPFHPHRCLYRERSMYGVSHSCFIVIGSVEAGEPVWNAVSPCQREHTWPRCRHTLPPSHLFVTESLLLHSQAAQYLHEEAARYPRKIHYHNPPDLAMEALEVKHLRLLFVQNTTHLSTT